MNTKRGMATLGSLCVLLFSVQGYGSETRTASLIQTPGRPGDIERAALGKIGFVVGEWEGDGWQQTEAGQRVRFWVRELYRYRGDKDLLDMEGESRSLLPDGTRSSERHYSLGILSYDRATSEYRMWHYANDGDAFMVKVNVDIEGKVARYIRQDAKTGSSRFTLKIGEDGVWVSTVERLGPDSRWPEVVEFRMKRVK